MPTMAATLLSQPPPPDMKRNYGFFARQSTNYQLPNWAHAEKNAYLCGCGRALCPSGQSAECALKHNDKNK